MGITKKFCIGAAGVIVAAGAFVGLLSLTSLSADAMTITDRQDCGFTDPIIDCGAQSTSELLERYNANDDRRGNKDIQAIFNHYGITGGVISDTSNIKHGWLNTNGQISVDGKVIGTGAQSLYRVDVPGKNLSPKKIGNKTYYLGPVRGNYSKGADVFVFYKNGKPFMAIQGSCGNPIPFVPKEQPKPAYACQNLEATKLDSDRYRFTTTASASNGAEVVNYSYDFGDGTTKTTTNKTIEHTYAEAGTYTIKVLVTVDVNGETKLAASEDCQTTITVEEQPETPTYKCVSLTATRIERDRYKFTTVTSTSGNAEVINYSYDFGDGVTRTTTAPTIEHTYAEAGDYTIKVLVTVDVNGETKLAASEDCQTTITVEEQPNQPVYKCESLSAEKINRDTYQFTAAAIAEDGATITNYVYNFGDGKSMTSTSTQVNHTYEEPGDYTATLTVNFDVDGAAKSRTGDNCKVNITVEEQPEQPAYKCESLTHEKINRTTFSFTADASTSGNAEVINYSYDFGDGSKKTTTESTVTHEYDEAGDYTIKVTVNFEVNGEAQSDTGPNCETNITVEEQPEVPVYKCENLTARLIKDRTYEYTLTYQADGGAELDRVIYDFGDDVSETYLPDDAASVEHTYATAGDYTTTTTLYFNVPENGEMVEKTKSCEVKVSIPKEEVPPCPTNPELPKDSPKCAVCPTNPDLPKDSPDCVPCPYNPELPKDSDKCVETPPELPKTGMEMLIGGSLGLGSITAAGYYWAASRRNLLDALLNK